MPEIKASRDLRVPEENRVLRIVGMDRIVQIDEGEGRTPFIRVEEFYGGCDTVRTLVLAGGIQTSEIIEQLDIRSCLCANPRYAYEQ